MCLSKMFEKAGGWGKVFLGESSGAPAFTEETRRRPGWSPSLSARRHRHFLPARAFSQEARVSRFSGGRRTAWGTLRRWSGGHEFPSMGTDRTQSLRVRRGLSSLAPGVDPQAGARVPSDGTARWVEPVLLFIPWLVGIASWGMSNPALLRVRWQVPFGQLVSAVASSVAPVLVAHRELGAPVD